VLPPEAPLGRGYEVFAECRNLKLDSRDLETKNDRGMATMPREIQENYLQCNNAKFSLEYMGALIMHSNQ